MEQNGSLAIRAAVLSEQKCEPLDVEQAISAVMDGSRLVWLHIRWEDQDDARKFLIERLKFHPLAVEDALNETERPALQEFGPSVFLSVGVPVQAKTTDIDFAELAFFLRDHSLVTVARADLEVVDDWFHRWEDHPDRIGDHPAFLMHALLDAAVDSYFPILDEIEEMTDDLTEKIFDGDATQLPNIMRLKRSLLGLRRAITPTRDVMNSLLRRDFTQVPADSKIYFQDVYDHALRLAELIDSNRDALTSVLDVHLSTVSNNLNNVMKKMTILSTVLMTAALIAGIYGMNFDKMPELHWRYGYPFAIGLMVASAAVTLLIFRKIRWL
ncbi:magnesium/cobalt transporter CorA [Fimbriimonas ginsengisoli]|uniref:Magnesium transport protein CorA n=1 Tax=Fimbriimonas ginsengisoli Gsoil 348 TaxID=661478 RepID=A0A068NUP8_FIMGI|nr:magnesium/cobalt transporter CorA [Fimbriimonas ginsengisoli]AIE87166.1 magnesium and cobalt transport protein CorA [Fimbriimonas ginsengisoli Gsoil 348]